MRAGAALEKLSTKPRTDYHFRKPTQTGETMINRQK